MRVRFHLDEHIPFGVAAGLRRRNIGVTCAAEVALVAVPDEKQLLFASQSGRVLVTQDTDFLRLHESGIPHEIFKALDELRPGAFVRVGA